MVADNQPEKSVDTPDNTADNHTSGTGKGGAIKAIIYNETARIAAGKEPPQGWIVVREKDGIALIVNQESAREVQVLR